MYYQDATCYYALEERDGQLHLLSTLTILNCNFSNIFKYFKMKYGAKVFFMKALGNVTVRDDIENFNPTGSLLNAEAERHFPRELSSINIASLQHMPLGTIQRHISYTNLFYYNAAEQIEKVALLTFYEDFTTYKYKHFDELANNLNKKIRNGDHYLLSDYKLVICKHGKIGKFAYEIPNGMSLQYAKLLNECGANFNTKIN